MSTVDLGFYFRSLAPDLSRIGAMLWFLLKGWFVCLEKQTLIFLHCPCSMSIQKGRFFRSRLHLLLLAAGSSG